MSYLALARKWRPTQFSQVVGQQPIVTALSNALTQQRLHHAYLLSGTRGVGKTTLGRLLAKGLNCDLGMSATPCGQCASCTEIDQGRHLDLLEIDAASRTKVEDTRELLDNVQYPPTKGRFKVYLIDEVHMLSRHSFNALLKTLEEPPEHVKFILATTDPHKLPATILSRCLQFQLRPIHPEVIEQQLKSILTQEQIVAHEDALSLLAQAADGSMRDALSLTDQAIALGNGEIQRSQVLTMLGGLESDQALTLLAALASQQTQQVMEQVQCFAERGIEWDALLQQLASQLHRIALYQALPETAEQASDRLQLAQLASQMTPQNVQLYYQIALKARADLPLAPSAKIALEMSLLRMLAFTELAPQARAIVKPILPVGNNGQVNEQEAPVVAHTPQLTQPSETQPVIVTSETAAPEPDFTPNSLEEEVPLREENTQPNTLAVAHPRHQLRQARLKAQAAKNNIQTARVTSPKKSEAVPPPSFSNSKTLLQERLAAPVLTTQITPESTLDEEIEEAYQWQPLENFDDKPSATEAALTPSQLKANLEYEKTPEVAARLQEETLAISQWAALITQMDLKKRSELLALNSSFEQNGEQVRLTLRPEHKHLNGIKQVQELELALSQVLGSPIQLHVELGQQGQSPQEIKEALYQQKLTSALAALQCDPNVQALVTYFDAKLDEESVRPL